MKIVFHELFYSVYTSDPASEAGRMEAIISELPENVDIIAAEPATEDEIAMAHTSGHIEDIRNQGLYDIAALAAGGAVQTAHLGLEEPAFGLIRPPGHHASADNAWGFCYFNNMTIALLALKTADLIETALVLDIDLHYGDGTVNILGAKDWVNIYNPSQSNREGYIKEVEDILSGGNASIIGISAGFDQHIDDWGGLLATEDYFTIGRMVKERSKECNGGYFALLEGGYNHNVLGRNVAALIDGLRR